MHAISADERATYDQDGVLCLRKVFPLDWIEELRKGVEVALANPGPNAEEYTRPGSSGRFFGDLDLSSRHEIFRRFVLESPAARIAGEIMAARKVNFFYDQLLVKERGTRERTPWHQDQPYWAVAGWQVCSIWLPLDVVSRDVCVEYVSGSHRWGQAFNPQRFLDHRPYEGTGLPQLPDIESERDRYRILGWDLEPGDCLIFQAMIVHGAAGNTSSTHRRRAYSTRWCGDDARFVRSAGEVAIPTSDPGLSHGAPLDCEMFPVVWTSD